MIAVIFISRNSLRIYDEYEKYSYNPLVKFNYNVFKENFRINENFQKKIDNFFYCKEKNERCDDNIKKKRGYYFFYEKK